MRQLLFGLLVATAASTQAWAEDAAPPTADDRFTISGSVGMAFLQGDEYVFEDGRKVSHLIWESDFTPLLTFEAEWRIDDRWAVLGTLDLSPTGNSYMEDYDWFDPDRDWTHRSRHLDTNLDRYVAIDVGVRYDLLRRDDRSLGVLGGFRYTDVQWTAYGGDFVYTSSDFRDTVGTFPEGEKGITYHQMLPALYLGPTGSYELYGVSLSGRVVGGAAFRGHAVDDHWMRDLRFEDHFDPAPFVGIQARIAYPIDGAASLFLNAGYERYFQMKASTTETDTTTGESTYYSGDVAGGSFSSLRFNAGLSIRF